MTRIRGIRDVAERHLCTGCGTCAFVQPDVVRIVDDLDQGRRPLVADGADTTEALQACPGIRLEHDYDPGQPGLVSELEEDWGPVLELWDGHAADPEIRWRGSSGGAATALALFAVQEQGFHGVLHIAAREDVPWLNRTVLSRSRDELVAATGSRYAPASPCDGLAEVVSAPGPCVLIGKPCDVAGARMAAGLRPDLAEKLGLTIAIFCAGAPSTAGTLAMLARMGFDDPGQVDSVRYRGDGWPGQAVASGRAADGSPRRAELSYQESWGEMLNQHRPWRCYVCADHTGEFADISVGDPWYHDIPEGEPGRSLIVARTERGRRFVERALAAGALRAEPIGPWALPASQPNLLWFRGSVWGRTLAMRLVGQAVPRLGGLRTRVAWRRSLTWREKLQSVVGTWKRIFTKRLFGRKQVRPFQFSCSAAVNTRLRQEDGRPKHQPGP